MAFDSASLGAQAKEITKELRAYDKARTTSAMSRRGVNWLQHGGAHSYWKGFVAFFQDLASFLGTEPDLLSLHENATAAVRFACDSIRMTDSPDLVITTDMEYPSVGIAIRNAFPDVAEVAMRDWTLQSGPSSTQLAKRLADKAAELARSRSGVKRIVLVTSHVFYESGCVLDIRALRDAMRPWECRLVIDGAQAVGNIAVDIRSYGEVDYYATCGHKWLMGRPSLGILVCGRSRYGRNHRVAERKVTRPFSTFAVLRSNDYASETIAMEPLISVNAMLSEFRGMNDWAGHNRDLANLFAAEVVQLVGLRLITTNPESGIVSIQVPDATLLRQRLDADHGIACQALGEDLLRFSFHYFQGDREVAVLLRSLRAAVRSTMLGPGGCGLARLSRAA